MEAWVREDRRGIGVNVGGSSFLRSFGPIFEIINRTRLIFHQARTFRDIDIGTVKIEKGDGRAEGAPYQPPEPSSQNIKPADGFKVYDGNCHCQAIIYTVETKPLTDIKVMSCNCSLCSRVGLSLYLRSIN